MVHGHQWLSVEGQNSEVINNNTITDVTMTAYELFEQLSINFKHLTNPMFSTIFYVGLSLIIIYSIAVTTGGSIGLHVH